MRAPAEVRHPRFGGFSTAEVGTTSGNCCLVENRLKHGGRDSSAVFRWPCTKRRLSIERNPVPDLDPGLKVDA
jgi:hypothetical protein